MSTRLKFDKLNNIRDLGGMKTADGRTVKYGKLVRSGHLVDLTGDDVRKINNLADVIVDLRTDKERTERANVEIPGTSCIHIPIVNSLTPGISREKESDMDIIGRMLFNPDSAKEYMCDMYRSFTKKSALSQYASFIRILMEPREKAVLWHCTAGKDRAGIAAALVEKMLGVVEDDIIADYLSTNTYIEPDIRFLTEYIKKKAKTDSLLADESLRYLFSAQRAYISAFYSEISREYGDFDTFVQKGLGLSADDILRIRDTYLE